MSNVKPYNGFQCTDCKIFSTEKEATEHQREIDMHNYIEGLVEAQLWFGITKDDVVEFIEKNFDDLVKFHKEQQS